MNYFMICLIKCSMKKIFSILIFTLCLLYCIFRPRQMALAAASGLSIWYHSVLPTLLPFSILSGIMVCSGIYDSLSERIHPWFSKVYPVRAPLIYPLIAGFLFGFPLGRSVLICMMLIRLLQRKRKSSVVSATILVRLFCIIIWYFP